MKPRKREMGITKGRRQKVEGRMEREEKGVLGEGVGICRDNCHSRD